MKISEKITTFEAKIWIGFKEGYDGKIHDVRELRKICQDFADEIKSCVTINPTEFIYVDGSEPGAWVGLIQYPRFIGSEDSIKIKAFELAERIMTAFKQFRITVVTTDGTYMLSNKDFNL